MEHNIEDVIVIAKHTFLVVRIYMLHSEIVCLVLSKMAKTFVFKNTEPSPLYRKDQNCPPSCARGKLLLLKTQNMTLKKNNKEPLDRSNEASIYYDDDDAACPCRPSSFTAYA